MNTKLSDGEVLSIVGGVTVFIAFAIVVLAGFFYSSHKERLFPYLYQSGSNENYEEAKYCLPDEWIELHFNERTIESRHFYKELKVIANGSELKSRSSGRHTTIISFKDKPVLKADKGVIKILIPDEIGLYGKTLPVNYSAKFAYPTLKTDGFYQWSYKNISGSILVSIATIEQVELIKITYRRTLYSVIASTGLLIGIVILIVLLIAKKLT